MITAIHPFIWFAVVATAVAFAAAILACRASRVVFRVLLGLVALVCLLPAAFVTAIYFPELVDERYWVYKSFYNDIKDGMTRDEVFALVDRRYPANGPRMRPKVVYEEPDKIGFFMNPERSGDPNCEGILLRLSAGRVIEKRYSPD